MSVDEAVNVIIEKRPLSTVYKKKKRAALQEYKDNPSPEKVNGFFKRLFGLFQIQKF